MRRRRRCSRGNLMHARLPASTWSEERYPRGREGTVKLLGRGEKCKRKREGEERERETMFTLTYRCRGSRARYPLLEKSPERIAATVPRVLAGNWPDDVPGDPAGRDESIGAIARRRRRATCDAPRARVNVSADASAKRKYSTEPAPHAFAPALAILSGRQEYFLTDPPGAQARA